MIIDGAKVDYGIIDQTIAQDKMTIDTSSDSPYSDLFNTVNPSGSRTKVAYLEKDYFLLDGTFVFPEDSVKYHVGWESLVTADSEGVIDDYVEYIFENTHVNYGIQIFFGEDTIASDFEIIYYDSGGEIGRTTVTGNKLVRYYNYESFINWNRIRIHFTKVNPQQRARFYEVTFGITDTYDEDLLLSVSASRVTDLTGDYDDCGDFAFTFFNDGRFDITDIKGLSQGLMEWLKVTIWVRKHGEKDYIKWGDYYSESTDVQDRGKTIVIAGFDELYKLGESIYKKGVVYAEGRSLGDWAEEVADDAGINLVIDSELYNIISTGYITEVPHREALRLIAEAGNAVLFVNKAGELELKRIKVVDKGDLPDDDIVDGTLTIANPDKNLGVNISRHTYLAAKDALELAHIDSVGLTEEHQQMEITYSVYPVITSTVQVFVDTADSTAQVGNIKVYSDRIVFDIWGEQGDESFVTITGIPYNQATSQVIRGSEVKNVKKIENNFLITGDLAEAVADWQFSRAVRKYDYEAEVVTEADLDLGDKVVIEKNNVIITKVSFSLAYGEHETKIGGVDE